VVGSVGLASAGSDILFTYTGDVLPSAEGWIIVGYPDSESMGAHIESGTLHITDLSTYLEQPSVIEKNGQFPMNTQM
jgi:hypothetical protein